MFCKKVFLRKLRVNSNNKVLSEDRRLTDRQTNSHTLTRSCRKNKNFSHLDFPFESNIKVLTQPKVPYSLRWLLRNLPLLRMKSRRLLELIHAMFRAITLNTWHKVRVIRTGLEGSLQLDSDPFVTGRSPAPMTSLNLGEPMYLGGFRYGMVEGTGRITNTIIYHPIRLSPLSTLSIFFKNFLCLEDFSPMKSFNCLLNIWRPQIGPC